MRFDERAREKMMVGKCLQGKGNESKTREEGGGSSRG